MEVTCNEVEKQKISSSKNSSTDPDSKEDLCFALKIRLFAREAYSPAA